MTTKQKILHEALKLFAKKGYDAVFVADIADAVGIKAPSLYKHYKNKQDIFDSCVKEFSQRMDKIHNDIGLPGSNNEQFTYETMSEDKLLEVAEALFLFYLLDDVAASFRKLLILERYRNQQLNNLFEKLFVDEVIQHETALFELLIKKGVLHGTSAKLLALRFYSPIFFLLQKYDMRHDELELAKKELKENVIEFSGTYGGNIDG